MQKPKLIWLPVVVFGITTPLAVIGVPVYAFLYGFDLWQVAAMVIGVAFCEISITAGYHRLWSHRAYDAHWLVRLFFAVGGTYATQNSILHWASDHRRHHLHVDDNQRDPYSAKRGFWYAHIGWMLRDYDNFKDTAYKNCNDLKKDPIVMWQHRHYLPLVLGINFGIPIILGLLHGDLIGMILLAGVARLVIAHHFTFLINSLAHIWGNQPYSDKNTSRDNGFLALLTMGEGYHNYHHSFQRDYRNGIRWWQFDPTKWLIRALSWCRLTENLYRTPVERIESARAQMLLNTTAKKIARLPHSDVLMLRLHDEYDVLMNKVNEFSKAKKQWMAVRKASMMEGYGHDVQALKLKVELLKQSFQEQKKQWLLLNARLA